MRRYRVALVGVAVVVPAMWIVVALFSYMAWWSGDYLLAPLVGAVAALVAWPLLTAPLYRGLTEVAYANPRAYSELCTRANGLQAQLDSLPDPNPEPPPAEREARKAARIHIEVVMRDLGLSGEPDATESGLRWMLGSGYVETWERLHRAEEALIIFESEHDVLAGALSDELRIIESPMANREAVLTKLRRAVWELQPSAAGYLTPAAIPQPTADDPAPTPERARAVLRLVRYSVDEFRDARRDGIVRKRNLLHKTSTLTALFTFGVLCVAMGKGAPLHTIVAGSMYYLVGTVVGLVKQLQISADAEAVVEDFGFATAQLLATPLLSGLAAVGGVILAAMLPLAAPPTDPALELLPFATVFNLWKNPYAVVVAAVFGLTPSLLISRLGKQAETYKAELTSTETSQHAAGG